MINHILILKNLTICCNVNLKNIISHYFQFQIINFNSVTFITKYHLRIMMMMIMIIQYLHNIKLNRNWMHLKIPSDFDIHT